MTAPKKFVLQRKKEERLAKKEADLKAKEWLKLEKEALIAAGIKPKRVIKRKPDKDFEKLKQPEVPEPENLDDKSALLQSVSWSNANTIAKKFSAGTTTTAIYQERVNTFLKMNEMAEAKGPLLPQTSIVGKNLDGKDKFNRR